MVGALEPGEYWVEFLQKETEETERGSGKWGAPLALCFVLCSLFFFSVDPLGQAQSEHR